MLVVFTITVPPLKTYLFVFSKQREASQMLLVHCHYHHHGLLFLSTTFGSRQSYSLINKKTDTRKIIPRAVDKESSSSSEFEVDRDKARRALQKLDQQLVSLSEKQLATPMIRAKDVDRPQRYGREEAPDFSGSFLGYSAFALLLLTLFYNVIFLTLIKPSIDFPEQVEAAYVGKASVSEPIPQEPTSSKASSS